MSNDDVVIGLLTGMIIILIAYATWLNIVWSKTRGNYFEASKHLMELLLENQNLRVNLLTMSLTKGTSKNE